jgi:hypothetical protein
LRDAALSVRRFGGNPPITDMTYGVEEKDRQSALQGTVILRALFSSGRLCSNCSRLISLE